MEMDGDDFEGSKSPTYQVLYEKWWQNYGPKGSSQEIHNKNHIAILASALDKANDMDGVFFNGSSLAAVFNHDMAITDVYDLFDQTFAVNIEHLQRMQRREACIHAFVHLTFSPFNPLSFTYCKRQMGYTNTQISSEVS